MRFAALSLVLICAFGASEAALRRGVPAKDVAATLSKAKRSETATMKSVEKTLAKVDNLLKREGGEAEAVPETAFAQVGLSVRRKAKRARAKAHRAQNPFPAGVYQYGSVLGNGVQDYNTPYYGSYSGNYGPIGQPPIPGPGGLGMGSFTPNMDPRGFGAALSNYSAPWEHGVHPMWPVPPNPYPLRIPQPYSPWQATPPFSQQGFAKMTEQNGMHYMTPFGQTNKMPNETTLMGPQPFGPYGVNQHAYTPNNPPQWAINPGVQGMYPGFGFPQHGVIPVSHPGYAGLGQGPMIQQMLHGGMQGFGGSPLPPMMNPQMAGQMPGPAGFNGAAYMGARLHPLVPHPALGAHPGMGKSGNGVGMPHPDWDRYHIVAPAPPAPAGGEAAAPAAAA